MTELDRQVPLTGESLWRVNGKPGRVTCPSCEGEMGPSWMAASDRFFQDYWECDCGLAAPLASLSDAAKRRRVVENFRREGSEQVRRDFDFRPPPTPARPESPQTRFRSEANLRCKRCGQIMTQGTELSHWDRFYDDYLECPDCEYLQSTRATSEVPSGKNIPRAHIERRPVEPLGALNPPGGLQPFASLEQLPVGLEAPELWGTYLLTLTGFTVEARLGLPQVCERTLIKSGDRILVLDDPTYPVGFHVSLPPGGEVVVPDLRLEVALLYEKLLEKVRPGDPRARRHLLAPLVTVCRAYRLAESPPFQLMLEEGNPPSQLLYLMPFVKQLLSKSIYVCQGLPVSLRDLGTRPGFISLSDLDLFEGEAAIFELLYGSYRLRPS